MLTRHAFWAATFVIVPSLGLAGERASVQLAALDHSVVPVVLEEVNPPDYSLAIQEHLAGIKAPNGHRGPELLSAVKSFYESRNFDPLWLLDGEASDQARQMVLIFRTADDDGLRPADYSPPAIGDVGDDPSIIAETEISFSLTVAEFIADLYSGRINPKTISRSYDINPELPDIADALQRLAFSNDMHDAVAHYEPPHPQYAALKARLSDLRAGSDAKNHPLISDGKSLKLGSKGKRVAALRERLDLPAATIAEGEIFDERVKEAVVDFQSSNGLAADGIVGPRTRAALNGVSREEKIAALVTNLERLRWLHKSPGTFRVEVNVPEFRLRVIKGDAEVHTTRVVVGKRSNPTPLFSDEIEHLVVNPFWNVPTSILKNEMMPAIRSNPRGYFARRGYQVLARVGGRTRVIDPAYIDWYGVNPRSIRVRQRPGSRNALGRIKFMFPNAHAVYLHDTPSKSLFKKDYRAYSHGCVRVHNPLDFAEALLAHEPDWNAARLERMYGGKERRVNLDQPVPVHLTYVTARIEADGSLRLFDDVYGHDEKLRAALDL